MIAAMSKLWKFIRIMVKEWWNDDIPRHAAAIAFYTAFSLPAFLVIVIYFAGLFLGTSAVESQVLGNIQELLGPDSRAFLQAAFTNLQLANQSSLVTILEAIVLLASAVSVMRGLQTALNTILGIAPEHRYGWLHEVRRYVLSFFLLIVTAVFLIGLTALSAYFASVSNSLLLPSALHFLYITDLPLTYLVITPLFFLLYLFLPDRRFPPWIVLLGALVASTLFVVGRFLVNLYIINAHLDLQYGVAASLLILLLWIYYIAHIFLLGAEFIDVFGESTKQRIQLAKSINSRKKKDSHRTI